MLKSLILSGVFLLKNNGVSLLKNNHSNMFYDLSTVSEKLKSKVILIGDDFSSTSDFLVEFNILNSIKNKEKYLLSFEWLDNTNPNTVPNHLKKLTKFGLLTFNVFGSIPCVATENEYNKVLANQIVKKMSSNQNDKSIIMMISLHRLLNISQTIQSLNPDLSIETVCVGFSNNITDWSAFKVDEINEI